jgi:hypothetical protein
MISCTPDRKIQIRNANNLEVAAFNATFEQIAIFFESYDAKFVEKVKNLYRQSPRENYILKALLAARLPSVEFNQIRYNSANPTHSIQNIQDFCFTKPNRLQEALGRDRFFLNTIGKDITQKSKIIPRKER